MLTTFGQISVNRSFARLILTCHSFRFPCYFVLPANVWCIICDLFADGVSACRKLRCLGVTRPSRLPPTHRTRKPSSNLITHRHGCPQNLTTFPLSAASTLEMLTRLLQAILGAHDPDETGRQLRAQGVPVADDPCRACASPCDQGHLEMPKLFLDTSTNFFGSMKPIRRHVRFSRSAQDTSTRID